MSAPIRVGTLLVGYREAHNVRRGDKTSTIVYEIAEDGVGTVTLNRPEVLNAVTLDMELLLVDTLRRADEDPSVRCIIVTGAGRGFCAGDDIKEAWNDPRMADGLASMSGPRTYFAPHVDVMLNLLTPTIAAVNGPAIGFGMDLALLCDLRIASSKGRFSQAFVKMGVLPDIAGFWLLPQLVGRDTAAELLMTGDMIDADRALALGLVSQVVPDDQLETTAHELARRVAMNPPLAVRYIKEALRRAAPRPITDLADLATILGVRLAELFASDDHREAVAAFIEHREARFTGH